VTDHADHRSVNSRKLGRQHRQIRLYDAKLVSLGNVSNSTQQQTRCGHATSDRGTVTETYGAFYEMVFHCRL